MGNEENIRQFNGCDQYSDIAFNWKIVPAKGGWIMTIPVFKKNLVVGRTAVPVLAFFMTAALVMTGHFLYYSKGGAAGSIAVMRGDLLKTGTDSGAVGANGGSGGMGSVNESAVGDTSGLDGASGIDGAGSAGSAGSPGSAGGTGGTGGNAAAVEETNGSGVVGGVDGTSAPPGPDSADALWLDSGVRSANGGGSDTVPGQTGGSGYVNRVSDGAADSGDTIYIYVTGAVRNPGVYEMPRFSMIVDAVHMAGGFTEQADVETMNMVYVLEKNALLNIKRKPSADDETAGGSTQTASTGKNTGTSVSPPYGDGVEISMEYDGVLLSDGKVGTGVPTDDAGVGGSEQRRINLNKATKEELTQLPGIGAATADKILAYRQQNGSFKAIEELMNISGIKQAKFDGLKDKVTV